MNADEIKNILKLHLSWLNGDPAGTRADLTRAVLTGAVLTDAVLTGAVLTGADLRDADLRDADLTRAVLTGADLRDAVLTGAVLTGAVLTGADLTGAVLSVKDGAKVAWHKPDPTLPRRVAEAALVPGALEMGAWHTCETTHCLAGWAIHLSGQTGAAMEALTSPSVAGSILMPSGSHMFFAGNDEALAWCREQIEKKEGE